MLFINTIRYEVRTGKKSPPLSKSVVKKQLKKADVDGDLKLDMSEWLEFSKKLSKMPEETFVKAFSGYKAALKNRLEADIKSQNSRKSVKVKEEVKRINQKTRAKVVKGDATSLNVDSVDPSANRKSRKSRGGNGDGLASANLEDDGSAVEVVCNVSICTPDAVINYDEIFISLAHLLSFA